MQLLGDAQGLPVVLDGVPRLERDVGVVQRLAELLGDLLRKLREGADEVGVVEVVGVCEGADAAGDAGIAIRC